MGDETPTVVGIQLGLATKLPMRAVAEAEIETQAGLVGDRYHGSKHRQLSVQSLSELQEAEGPCWFYGSTLALAKWIEAVFTGSVIRPEMIGTIFTYRYNDKINRKHEYHSLAVGPLAAEFRGARDRIGTLDAPGGGENAREIGFADRDARDGD